MICGSITDGKLQQFSSAISSTASVNNDKIKELITRKIRLDKSFESKIKIPQSDFDQIAFKRFENEVSYLYQSNIEFCEQTERQSRKMFTYKDHNAVMEGSLEFINFVKVMLQRKADLEPFEVNPYFILLRKILERGELKLDSLSWKQNEPFKENLKMEVGVEFQNLCYKLLANSQFDLNSNMSLEQLKTTCLILVLAFFRIKEYRVKLLSIFQGSPYQDFFPSPDIQQILFGWDEHIWNYVRESQRGRENLDILENTIAQTEKQKFDRFIYLNFLIEWITNVESILVVSGVDFNNIPGYVILREKFVNEFLLGSIFDQRDTVGKVCYHMMSNNENLTYFTSRMVSKLNPQNKKFVELFFYCLTQCGKYFYDKEMSFPLRFKIDWFEATQRELVKEDQIVGIFSSLNFIYLYFPLFPLSTQKNIVKIFESYYSLFLHWDVTVQLLFIHIIIYRFVAFYEKKSQDISNSLLFYFKVIETNRTLSEKLKNEIRIWENKQNRVYKRKHSFQKIKGKLSEDSTLIFTLYDVSSSRYASYLNLQYQVQLKRKSSECLFKIDPPEIGYCESCVRTFDEVFNTYIASSFRTENDEKKLPILVHRLCLDKKEMGQTE